MVGKFVNIETILETKDNILVALYVRQQLFILWYPDVRCKLD